MREAGSNLAYAAVTQLSDSMVQGVDTYGLDGVVRGRWLGAGAGADSRSVGRCTGCVAEF